MRYFILIPLILVSMWAKADISSVLQKKSKAASSSVTSNVASEQTRQQKKLTLQLKIDVLRNQIGSATDAAQKQSLEAELITLEKMRNNM